MKNLFLLFTLIITFGCSKNKEPESPTKDETLYKKVKIDYNNDGKPDLNLEIGNSGTQDIPQSSGSNIFFISSADSNLSFLSKSINLDNYWFEDNKVITIDSTSNFSFVYFYSFLYRRNIAKGNYISDWIIDTEFSSKKNIIFRYNSTHDTKFGWIKLDFNIYTKKIIIVDYYETTLKSFVSGKK